MRGSKEATPTVLRAEDAPGEQGAGPKRGERGGAERDGRGGEAEAGGERGGSIAGHRGGDLFQVCPTFWRLWATLEKEKFSWSTHYIYKH